jgi:hypothetical protein
MGHIEEQYALPNSNVKAISIISIIREEAIIAGTNCIFTSRLSVFPDVKSVKSRK